MLASLLNLIALELHLNFAGCHCNIFFASGFHVIVLIHSIFINYVLTKWISLSSIQFKSMAVV